MQDDNDESAAHHASAETTSPPRTLHERKESGTAEVHHDSATAQTSATPPPASSVSTSSAASTPNQPEITASPVFLTCSNGWRKDAVVDNDLSNQVSFSFTGTMHDAARNGSVESFDAFADYLSKWSPLSSLGYEPEPRHMAMHLQAAYKIGRKKTYPTETALRRAVREHVRKHCNCKPFTPSLTGTREFSAGLLSSLQVRSPYVILFQIIMQFVCPSRLHRCHVPATLNSAFSTLRRTLFFFNVHALIILTGN